MTAPEIAPPEFWHFLADMPLPTDDECRAVLRRDDVRLVVDFDEWIAEFDRCYPRAGVKTRAVAANVYAYLHSKPAWVDGSPTRWCLTERHVAALAGCSKTQARNAMVMLEAAGLLEVDRTGRYRRHGDTVHREANASYLASGAAPLNAFHRYAALALQLLHRLGRSFAWAASVVRRGAHGAGAVLRALRLGADYWRGGSDHRRRRLAERLLGLVGIRQGALPLAVSAPPPMNSDHRRESHQRVKTPGSDKGGPGGNVDTVETVDNPGTVEIAGYRVPLATKEAERPVAALVTAAVADLLEIADAGDRRPTQRKRSGNQRESEPAAVETVTKRRPRKRAEPRRDRQVVTLTDRDNVPERGR